MAESQFSRPALPALINRLRTDLLTRLGEADELRRSDAEVYARVLGEGINGLYGYLDWQARQYLPDLGDQESVERWGNMLGEWYAPAEAASGSVPVVGSVGASIPLSARWQSQSGLLYKPVASVVIDASPKLVEIVCEQTGSAGNLAEGEPLTLISPIAGVQSQAVVPVGGVAGGAEQEDIEGLRAKVLRRLSRPPQGGSRDDYESWALAAHPSVTRAWVYPLEQGPNTVVVRIVCDRLADPIPTPQVIAAVQAYIDARCPVTTAVFVLAPVAELIAFSIDLTPNTPEVRAQVQSQLADLLRREGEPGGTLLRSRMTEAISLAAGETNHVLAVPATDLVLNVGHFPVMGVITWL
ncbi:baseplate J/gp47 family protein [Pseudomonas tohonis]|uniref:baseplate J/gp47 family protein n=1 Tax=Pseudomonas tohonis TaxID=2725477 RepID=UPI001F442707|nr:baseplate J/gp47 family protein [Pseudomonas tohonis]